MRQPPNWFLRITVPLLFVAGGVLIFFAVFRNTTHPGSGTAQTVTTGSTPGQTPTGAPPTPASTPSSPGANPADTPPAATTPTPPAPDAAKSAPRKYAARAFPMPAKGYTPLGATTPRAAGGTYEMQLEFAPFGVGLARLTLANHTEQALTGNPKVLQEFERYLHAVNDPRQGLAAFSARGVVIDGAEVFLGFDPQSAGTTLWRETAPGAFEAVVADGDGKDTLRVTRVYVLEPGKYEFRIEQRIENLTDRPLKVEWRQIGPIDQPPETVRYGGDPRHVRFGYLLPAVRDPSQTVQSDTGSAAMLTHADALGSPDATGGYPRRTLWPNRVSQRDQLTLVWAAMTSRYFTVAVMPPPGSLASGLGPGQIERVAIPIGAPASAPSGSSGPFAAMGLEMVYPAAPIAPGAAREIACGVYAGPSSQRVLKEQPMSGPAGLAAVVVYTFGGPCGFCTFQTVTALLRGLLGALHDYVLHDWGLAVIALVVCVRTLLHPVTRWSQIRMLRSSKLMQKLAPKQKAIQEKYANDPDMRNRELARLMQEEGMGAGAGMAMGCVPAFLQMPVWVALSATLYFLFDLRHQRAFFGVFQRLTGDKWTFFSDLANPDHFIAFGREFRVPLLSSFMGPIDGLNIMPILMGVMFFIQQKYLTPPPTAPMSPEQEQQMKIMRVMTVVMFPLFMYNAPSALALYFFTNSTLGILESRYIRRNAERKGLDQPPVRKRGETGKPGMLARLAQLAEERQRMMDQAKKMQARRDKGRK